VTDEEERYTFSSLMTSLIGSETKLRELYETTREATDDAKLKVTLVEFGKNCSKRLEMMQRARRESVVEMLLQPITGLKLGELTSKIDKTFENTSGGGVERLIALEETVSELYARASPGTMGISADTGQLLMTLSRESMERKHELERYLHPP
jgi:hypothetical protein